MGTHLFGSPLYKAIKLVFYKIINPNQRLWLSPRHHWYSYFAQLRTLCRVKYLADSACRYCDSWREYAFQWNASTFGNLQYDHGGSALWIERLDLHYCKISARFHSLTEMSRDRNGQTETARPNRPGRNDSDRNGSDRKVLFRLFKLKLVRNPVAKLYSVRKHGTHRAWLYKRIFISEWQVEICWNCAYYKKCQRLMACATISWSNV